MPPSRDWPHLLPFRYSIADSRGSLRGLPIAGGCDQPAAGCEVHHLTRKADGGKTSVNDCGLFCFFITRSSSTNGAGPSC